jgi:hypothetical protein
MKHIYYLLLIFIINFTNASCRKEKEFDLAGSWLRTTSTSSINDDMIINVNAEKTVGIITYRPTSATGFAVDDVKWKGIVSQTSNSFHVMDRLANGSYVDGTIYVLDGGNELLVNGVNGGQNYTQTWIRK